MINIRVNPIEKINVKNITVERKKISTVNSAGNFHDADMNRNGDTIKVRIR